MKLLDITKEEFANLIVSANICDPPKTEWSMPHSDTAFGKKTYYDITDTPRYVETIYFDGSEEIIRYYEVDINERL